MSKPSCKDCNHLKARLPVKKGKLLLKVASAKCSLKHGLLNTIDYLKGRKFNVNLFDNGCVEWDIYGQLCKGYISSKDATITLITKPKK